MAMSLTLTTINGQIVHEVRAGVERFYVPDPIGNTVALVDTTGTVTDTWIYSPYGQVLAHGGPSMTSFTSFGTWGYFTDAANRLYVRARVFLADLARWLTLDLLWPSVSPYPYAKCRPFVEFDPSGLGPIHGGATTCRPSLPGGEPVENPEKREPCISLLREAPEKKEYGPLIACLGRAKKDSDEIRKCIAESGIGVIKSNIIKYITCESVQGFPGFSELGNPCKPVTEGSCYACCDMNYQNCLWECSEKTGASWGICVTKCQYAVLGLYNCVEKCGDLE